MPPHPLTNFEIQQNYQNELKFNGVYSRNNLLKIKDGAIINLDDFKSIGTHQIPLYVNGNNRRASYHAIYFDSLEVEQIQKEIKKSIVKQKYNTNVYRIQAYDSIMCGYFCTGFIDFMVKGKSFLDYTNLFSPNDYEKNDKIILKYFQ